MSTYSNRLQPALQNPLQRVVRFFHPRSSCTTTHISADVCGRWKSLVKPVMRQNILSCSVLSPEIVMHDNTYIGGRSVNNIKCVVHDDLRWKNRTTLYILPHHWLYEWFSQFRGCGTYSVFHGALRLFTEYLRACVCFKGVAFRGLPDVKLYPAVSAVYGNTEVSMVYLGHPLDGWSHVKTL